MLAGSDAGIGELQGAGILLRRRDHVLGCAVGQVLGGDQRVGNVEHERDRHEVVERIVRQLLIEPRIEHDIAQPADEQRVAVGRRIDHGLGPDDGAGAGPILDHRALA